MTRTAASDVENIASCAEKLRTRLTDSLRARRLGRPGVVCAEAVIPILDLIGAFSRARALGADPMLWARPQDGVGMLGVGAAWRCEAAGAERFRLARDIWERVLGQAEHEGALGPVLVGGFGFADTPPGDRFWAGFAPASLVLPRVLVWSEGAQMRLVVSVAARPGGGDAEAEVNQSIALATSVLGSIGPDDAAEVPSSRSEGGAVVEELPIAAAWKSSVAAAAEAARGGSLTKVVLARAVKIRPLEIDPVVPLRRLQSAYPTCTLFAATRGRHCFIGATPERLARLRDGVVSTIALAGSAPRGRTDEEDRQLGEALLSSAKDRVEHAVVVAALEEGLAGLCERVSVPAAPALLRVSNVQHLCTPIEGIARKRVTVLDVAARLHPTPAVGGMPREDALEWIRRHEGLDRGWYAGAVGWVDRRGDGEFAVALRSALLTGTEAVLFAGCGIVADSDPQEEYAESALKLRPMLSALGINGASS